MIKLNNVIKTYTSKTNQKVDALRGVNFELGNKGMVFILGKSGSGKSTLLNLLGGLDNPTDGEITVDGVSMKDFKPTDYDGYRNGYVGFVFQEYNLLDDFNVKDNVALALQLSHGDDVDNKVKEALRKVELTDEYLTRRVNEMSGGEKQRIAIARCIVKDSKMILADEPTGNLDSATGESIWNILKNLSQSKLVVVVSHDRESAEKYADRIIEIADGKVIADNGVQNKVEEKTEVFKSQQKHLSNKTCLKMGVDSMGQRKLKTASVIILAVLTVLVLLVTELFIAYTPEKLIANFVEQYDVPFFQVSQKYPSEDGELVYSNVPSPKALKYISDNSQCLINNVVENKQQLLDFGFTFVGEALELDSNSFYVTSDTLENCYEQGLSYVMTEDGNMDELVKEWYPIESLIGRKVNLWYVPCYDENSLPTLAGVIDCDKITERARDYLPQYFVRDEYIQSRLRPISFNQSHDEIQLDMGTGKIFNGEFSISKDMPGSDYRPGALMTADGLKSYNEYSQMTLADDEIILSFDTFTEIFSGKTKWYYVDFNFTEAKVIPDEIGQTFPLDVYNSVTGEKLYGFAGLKLVGIFFEPDNAMGLPTYSIVVSEQNFKLLNKALDKHQTILISTDSVSNLTAFLTTLRKSYLVKVDYAGGIHYANSERFIDIAREAESGAYSVRESLFVMSLIGVIMLVVLVFLVINLISLSITNRKKEIGILSALGTPNRDIAKIFVFETLIIACISFVITLGAIFGVAALLSFVSRVAHELAETVHFFIVDGYTILALTVFTFAPLLLAALIPLRKISKLKPIDAIRNVK